MQKRAMHLKTSIIGAALLLVTVGMGVGATFVMRGGISLGASLFVGYPDVTIEKEKADAGSNPDVTDPVDTGDDAVKSRDAETELQVPPDYVAPSSRRSAIVTATRQLNALQTKMASGASDAPKALKSTMLSIASMLDQLDAANINSSDAEAGALYVLSGGNPESLKSSLKSQDLSNSERTMLQTVQSYAAGKISDETHLLSEFDIEALETTLRAQFLVAQAQLLPEKELERSISKLAFAADTVPGSLIEEAAIRRIIARLAHADNTAKLLYWADRYLRRFPQSLYYEDFENHLIKGLVDFRASNIATVNDSFINLLVNAGPVRSRSLVRAMLLNAIRIGDAQSCQAITGLVKQTYDLKSSGFEDIDALAMLCDGADTSESNIMDLKLIDISRLDGDVASYVIQAVTMSETISNSDVSSEVQYLGPELPLSVDPEYSVTVASVAQQLDATTKLIDRMESNESYPKNGP
jgi:hypothetical protein